MPITECAKCGTAHTRMVEGEPRATCKGHARKRDNAPCGNLPMRGQRVCRFHGGLAPQGRAAAARREAEAKAAKVLVRFGRPIETTPSEALLDTVRWTAGHVAWLRVKVAAIESDDAVAWGLTRETEGDVVVGTGSGASLETANTRVFEAGANVWVRLLGEWTDRLAKVCAAALHAGIEERRVKLAEQQGALVADAIRAILDDLGLNADQKAKAAEAVPRRLRLIAG